MNLRHENNLGLVRKTRTAVLSQWGLSSVLIMASWNRPEVSWVVSVIAGIWVLNFVRWGTTIFYDHVPRSKDHQWYLTYVFVTLLAALAWGFLTARLVGLYGKADDLVLIAFIMCAGIGAGSTNILSPNKWLARFFISAVMIPTPIQLLIHGGFAYNALAAAIVIYYLFLWVQININCKMIDELRSRKSQVRAFEDATMEAIVIHDNGKILEVNKAFEQLFGLSEAEVQGTDIGTYVLEPLSVRSLEGDGGTPSQTRAQRKDGSVFYIEQVSRWFLYEGRRVRVTCIQDITSRRQAEEAIQAREQLALDSARTKSQFLANMSHEIRTPLNAIIGITDLLADTPANEMQRRYFRTLKDSGEALLNLINDILDFSKIDAEKFELEHIEFNIVNAVEGQVNLLASKAHQKNISLEISIDPQLPMTVSGDYGRLGQILLNLVSNAIKFTARGRVLVTTRLLSATETVARVRFEVSDTGVGITEESAAILFRPFTQADSSTARKHGGTGLGLSISQRIVHLMQGEIGFDSTVGKGTTFWFEVPFPIVNRRPLASYYKDNALAQKSVLVIADNMPNLDALSGYLKSWEVPAQVEYLEKMEVLGPETILVAAGESFVQLEKKMTALHSQAKVIVLEMNGHNEHKFSFRVKATLPTPVRYSDLFNALHDKVIGLTDDFEKKDMALQFSVGRVLVAEDNSTNQMIIVAFLKQFGVHCQIVNNGLEAVEAFLQGGYDLILMDCQMPELDGFEATERIRQLEKNSQHIPIVALTANALKEDRERCFAAGMDDFLTKPIRKERLQEVLVKFLPKERSDSRHETP